jgi:outer membrane protein TolC
VRKNQSEKLIVTQEIVEVENRINFLANRLPQPVERVSAGFFDLNIHALSVGVPAQLLQNRADIRQAERELEAAGLDVQVARAHFFPRVDITAGVGYQAFNPRYLFWTPDALIYNLAGDLVAPLINKKAIQAEYRSANARQLESVYNYQRAILTAFTEVVNRVSRVENYSKSIEIKKQQLESLEASVDAASKLFQSARVEYVEVLLAQRDLLDARMVLIETKQEQLAAIVNAYQALGGGYLLSSSTRDGHLDAAGPPCLPGVQSLPAPREEKGAPEPPRLPDIQQLPAPRKEQGAT